MTALRTQFARLIRDEDGQDLIEYALLATFVSLVVVSGAAILGESVNRWYDTIEDRTNTAAVAAAS